MLTLSPAVRVFLALGATDLRLGFDGLAAIAREAIGRDPLSGALFVFSNSRRTRIRVLTWDGSGYWLMTKRLEAGTFAWPRGEPGIKSVSLRGEELAALLAGVEVEVRRRPKYERRPA